MYFLKTFILHAELPSSSGFGFESWTYVKVKAQKLKCGNTGWGPEKLRSFEAQFQSKHVTVMRSVLQKHPALHREEQVQPCNAVESLWHHLPPIWLLTAQSTLGKFASSLENVYRSTNQKMLKTFGLSCLKTREFYVTFFHSVALQISGFWFPSMKFLQNQKIALVPEMTVLT